MTTRSQKRLKLSSPTSVKVEGEAVENIDHKNGEVDVINYEEIRLENIRRNQEFLSSLGLDSDRLSQPKSAPSTRGAKRSSKGLAKAYTVPVRRSGRVTIERIKADIEDLRSADVVNEVLIAEKEAELAALLTNKLSSEGTYYESNVPSYEAAKRLDSSPISLLDPSNDTIESDNIHKNLISAFKYDHNSRSSDSSSASNYIEQMKALKVNDSDIAKLTESRITSIVAHPSEGPILVAAGDKLGYLGLWNVDEIVGSHGGVYRYKPHVSTIIKLHVTSVNPEALFSVSYDGTVRSTDLHSANFVSMFEAPESIDELIFTDCAFSPSNPYTAIIARSDGYACLVDFRQSSKAYASKAVVSQESKLNSIQYLPCDESYLVTAVGGRNGAIIINDIRKFGTSKPLKEVRKMDLHRNSINAAYATCDGKFVVSVAYDNTIRVWKDPAGVHGSNLNDDVESVSMTHDNNTGRWLSTFRPTMHPSRGDVFMTGSMQQPRRIELFSISESKQPSSSKKPTKSGKDSSFSAGLSVALMSDALASVCSRNAFHPTKNMVFGGNSSGRVHVFR